MAKKFIYFVLLLGVVYSCEMEAEPTMIKEVKLCTDLVEGECGQDAPYFSPYTNTFYVSCVLANATEKSTVSFYWYYFQDGERTLLDQIILKPKDLAEAKSNEYMLIANLNRNNSFWKEGRYEVKVVLEAEESYFVTRSFNI